MQLELFKMIKDLTLSILRTPHQLPSQLETLGCIMTPLAEAVPRSPASVRMGTLVSN